MRRQRQDRSRSPAPFRARSSRGASASTPSAPARSRPLSTARSAWARQTFREWSPRSRAGRRGDPNEIAQAVATSPSRACRDARGPCLPARVADQWLCLLHRHAFARSPQGRLRGREARPRADVARGRRSGLGTGARGAPLGGVTRVAEIAVADAEFQAAAGQFSEKQLADLTIPIGLMNAYSRIAISFRAMPEAARHA